MRCIFKIEIGCTRVNDELGYICIYRCFTPLVEYIIQSLKTAYEHYACFNESQSREKIETYYEYSQSFSLCV